MRVDVQIQPERRNGGLDTRIGMCVRGPVRDALVMRSGVVKGRSDQPQGLNGKQTVSILCLKDSVE
jgi:hypothetical protein